MCLKINLKNVVLDIMKIALCFFGITRSLKFTKKSIQEKIFNVFTKNNIEYDIFLHTYILDNYENIRAQEKCNNMDNEEYKLLNPTYFQLDNQDEIKSKINIENYRTHPDPWNTNYNSVDNFILAQYSKFQIVKMIQKTNNVYDYVIYLRPDVLYIDDFDINFFNLVTDKSIAIPNFHLHPKMMFNDRFAICNKNDYLNYGNIFENLLILSRQTFLHSETILAKYLLSFDIKYKYINFKFARVRCDGRVHDRF